MRFLCITMLMFLMAGSAHAQRKSEWKHRSGGRESSGRQPANITSEQEAAVLEFVGEHYPELRDLLTHLKESDRKKQYERALWDLHMVSSKLSFLKKHDSPRYDLDLKAWKVRSRIQLLTAKLSMEQDHEELKNQLRSALAEQHDLRRESLRLEGERLRQRELKVSEELANLDARREEMIEKQFQQLTSPDKPRSKPGSEDRPKNTTRP